MPSGQKPRPLADRFVEQIRIDIQTGCWLWCSRLRKDGYGKIKDGQRRTQMAHRVAYELLVGQIPDGLTLDHLCRNRSCVNPAHLEPVSFRENVLRGAGPSAENARKTHCVNGHPLQDENLGFHLNGHRYCRTCKQARNDQRKAA